MSSPLDDLRSSLSQKRVRSTDLDPAVREGTILASADLFSRIFLGATLAELPEGIRQRAEKILVDRARFIEAQVDALGDLAEELSTLATQKAPPCEPVPTA